MQRPSRGVPIGTMKHLADFEYCAKKLKALADKERLRIVECLLAGPKNVGEVAAELDEEIVKVSHHLGVLRDAELVQSLKQGASSFTNCIPM